ncbi:MAG: SDR family NAD(P)-dependent oxidoreductase [Bacteroidota bacterium]
MKKTYLITGAGTGIGKASAKKLSAQGHRLILCGRRTHLLEELNNELAGDDHICLGLDVSNKEKVKSSFQSINLEELNLAGVFANAGIGGENEYGESDRWEEIININLSGVYYTIMESIPSLKKSKEKFKHIMITSSCLARFGVPYYTAYCASKSGLLGLTKALAIELAPFNILVNSITPGWVETEMAKAGIKKLADHTNKTYDETYREQMGLVPTGKMSDPEEIANFLSFMFSNEQTSITGQALDINNGAFMI